MIQHIFKILWNERKINTWLLVEYIIIFCILWFCGDYLYTLLNNYYAPQGYDLKHVYRIEMQKKPSSGEENSNETDEYGMAMTFQERVKHYPGIESLSFSIAAIPYGFYTQMSPYKINEDSVAQTLQQRYVSTGFFDVFKIKVDGQIFDWTDNTAKDNVIITPFRDDKFGDNSYHPFGKEFDKKEIGVPIPILEAHTLRYDHDWDGRKETRKVIGRAEKIRTYYDQPFTSSIIMPLERERVNLRENQITIRVTPEADKDFIERFTRDMREQLFIGPYYLASVVSLEKRKNDIDSSSKTGNQINSAYAISLFLIVNVFLGILGSFWFRIQSRRSEIGLRIALGSSKKKVQGMIIFETLLLLCIASIISTVICLNLSDPEIIRSLGIPTVDKEQFGIGSEQNVINFAITFGFLAIVSVLAVWYPARQASKIQPAEALHNE